MSAPDPEFGSPPGHTQVRPDTRPPEVDGRDPRPAATRRGKYQPAHRRRRPAERGSTQGGLAATLVRGSSWNAAAQLTPVVINLVLTPYLIHGLGIEQYGLYALAATITIFLGSFDGGIGSTAPRFFSVYAGRDDRWSSTRLLCSLAAVITLAGGVVSVGDWFLAPVFSGFFRVPARYRTETVFLLRTFGVLLTVSLLHSLFVSVLQARQRFSLTGKATVLSYLGWAAGLYVTVQQHLGLRGIALSLIAEQVMATLIVFPSALRYLSRSALGLAHRREVRHFFGYAARVQTTGIAGLVNMEFDALIIGAILPARNVGLYNAGANVATQTRYTATSVLPPLSNHLATVYGRDGDGATRREMVRLQRMWVTAVSGFSAAAVGAAYFGVVAWLGPRFRISALVCLILLAGHGVNLLTGIMTSYVGAVGKPGLETRYGVLSIVVNVALTVPLAFFGVLGIVGATAVGSIVGSAYLIRIVHKRLATDVPSFFRDVPLLRSLLCVGVTAGLEVLIAPIVPSGPLGLLACGVPALIGLGFFAVSVLGVRRSVRVARTVAAGRSPLELLRI